MCLLDELDRQFEGAISAVLRTYAAQFTIVDDMWAIPPGRMRTRKCLKSGPSSLLHPVRTLLYYEPVARNPEGAPEACIRCTGENKEP